MIELYKHNQIAYEKVCSMFKHVSKAAVIHPTGTGKSYIAFKLALDNLDKTVCWLSPSEYIYKTQIESIKYKPSNIKFFTYSKLMYLTSSDFINIKPDYIVLDEFHRCGADIWGEKVNYLLQLYPSAKILGLSATHIRYLDNKRDMSFELFDGNVASSMTLGEALVTKILPTPKYITAIYSYDDEVLSYQNQIEKIKNSSIAQSAMLELDKLKRALDKSRGLNEIFNQFIVKKDSKFIAFCSNKKHLDEMVVKCRDWLGGIDSNPNFYIAYSQDPDTEQSFLDFKKDNSDSLKVLFCIDILNEGIHVSDVSGIILFRPTTSPIIYKQQIGRALSSSNNDIPLIFDIVNNFSNLYSVGSIKQEMDEAINHFSNTDNKELILVDDFDLYEEVSDAKVMFENLQTYLQTPWEEMYEYAKEYFNIHNHLNIGVNFKTSDGYALGNWIKTQRLLKRQNQLSQAKISKLEEIQIVWQNPKLVAWEENFNCAKKFFEEFNNLDIECEYIDTLGVRLGQFIKNCRQQYNQNTLSYTKIQKLESIGMIWNKSEDLFSKNYNQLLLYFQEYKDINVPATYVDKDNYALGAWLNKQKRKYINNELSESQIEKLQLLNINWDNKYNQSWENAFLEAKKHFTEFGNINVKTTFITSSGFKLGDWINKQRENKKLSKSRIDKLNSINMIWEKADPWMFRFNKALEFYKEFNHLNIPSNYIVDGVNLNKWLSEQKLTYKGKRVGVVLTNSQIELLESISIDWFSNVERQWETRFMQVYNAYKLNGSAENFTGLDLDEQNLRRWILKQKKMISNGKIPFEYKERLNDIGIY